MTRKQRHTRRPRRGGGFRKLLGLLIIAAGIYWIVYYVLPNRAHVDPDWMGQEKPIFVQGEFTGHSADGTGEGLLLPLPVLQDHVDGSIRYEEKTKSVILTTQSELLYMQADSKDAKLNNRPLQLRLAPERKDDTVYVPADSLKNLYGLNVQEDQESGAVLLMKAGESVPLASVKGEAKDTEALRTEPDIHAPIVADMPGGTKVRVWRTEGEWLYAQMDNGRAGYVKAGEVASDGTLTVEEQTEQPTRAERDWSGKTVNLTWEAVYERKPNPESIGKLDGVNVVSPTWFSIVDTEGNVRSKADQAYVNWAHGQGMEVWGLLSNSFDAELTTQALSTYDNRMRTILQMLEYSRMYQLDGINIDFENVHTKDGPNVTQFMRELRPMAQAENLVVSIDVTPKSNSEMWSVFLDRRALAESVDFMMVMAYDEHWASSPKAGSVASLPWVESAVNKILEEDEVPPSKLVLGIPLYTRVWTETVKDGKTKVSSKAIGMKAAAEILQEKKLKPKYNEDTGQNYVEYKDEEGLRRIWLEDAVSLKARVELAKSYGLGGVASWTRSFAGEGAWETLKGIHQ